MLLLTEKQDGEIGGCFGSHVRETNGRCRSEGEERDGDHQGITKQETEKGEGCFYGEQGEELGKLVRD